SPEEAVRYFTAAIAARPGSVNAHQFLGVVLRNHGKIDEAIACYRRALELDPEGREARWTANFLGSTLCNHKHDYEGAIAAFRRGLTYEPNSGLLHGNLGVALSKQGKRDEAIACFRKSIQLDPGDVSPYTHLARALMDQGKVDEAIPYLRQAVQLDPKDAN